MPVERDIIEAFTSDTESPHAAGPTNTQPPTPTSRDPGPAQIEIIIDRDLAVQLVGSDAGKAKRMRPHGAMTAGGSPQEFADVQAIMEPFLRDEIRRVYGDKTHRPKVHVARATPRQAESLKAFCVRFAAVLELHLSAQPGDDRRYRSQQRLGQARRVIAQVNAALGGTQGDGRTLAQCRRAVQTKVEGLDSELMALRACATDDDDASVAALLEFHESLRLYLSRNRASE
jgi:hypothetical protein